MAILLSMEKYRGGARDRDLRRAEKGAKMFTIRGVDFGNGLQLIGTVDTKMLFKVAGSRQWRQVGEQGYVPTHYVLFTVSKMLDEGTFEGEYDVFYPEGY